MTSIVMQPEINSAGASGVIFGILGSLLVAHLRGTEEIPPSVKRSLQGSTMFFATVALVVGFLLPGVDNAAHVGGLIAGICMGLAFHSPRPAVRFAAPAVFAAVIVAIGFALGQRSAAVTPAEAKYLESIEWFVGRENSAVSKWLEMVNLAKAKSISDTALADRLDNELVTFWREASQRFESVELEPGTELHNAHQYMRKLTSGRLHAIELCVSGLRTNDGKLIDRCIAEMQQGDELINARLKELEEKK
jgi:rhomboid protease GluP